MSILTVSTYTLGVVFVMLYFLSHLALVILIERLVCVVIFETLKKKEVHLNLFQRTWRWGGGWGVKRDVGWGVGGQKGCRVGGSKGM